MMNNQYDRIIADRDEEDSCTKCTPGCCIDHEAEHRAYPDVREGTCEPW